MTAPTMVPTHVFGDAVLSKPSLGQNPNAYPSGGIFPSASVFPGSGAPFSGSSTVPVNVIVDANLAAPGVFDAVLQTT